MPYRNSKLTYLLQDSLSGDSKALMFVNVSTDADDVPETLCSLRFAARAHDVALGQAKKNVAPARGRPMGRPLRRPERRFRAFRTFPSWRDAPPAGIARREAVFFR